MALPVQAIGEIKMETTQSPRQAMPADTRRRYASSPCWMHEVDPSYLGYWSQDEVLAFLKSLLARECIGTQAFADIGKAVDVQTADLILASELTQASICILLQEEIAARGAAAIAPLEGVTNDRHTKSSLEQAIAAARSNQAELILTIEQAVLNILDSELNSHLTQMLQLHWNQMEQLDTLLIEDIRVGVDFPCGEHTM
jgi:hypothetical protein